MKCIHYLGPTRCENEATVHLIDDEGMPNPGSHYCQQHADEIIAEYAEKLNEQWSTLPVDKHGSIVGLKEKGARHEQAHTMEMDISEETMKTKQFYCFSRSSSVPRGYELHEIHHVSELTDLVPLVNSAQNNICVTSQIPVNRLAEFLFHYCREHADIKQEKNRIAIKPKRSRKSI